MITGSAVFMVSGTLPAAAATLKLLEHGMVDSQSAVTLVAAVRPFSDKREICRVRTPEPWFNLKHRDGSS